MGGGVGRGGGAAAVDAGFLASFGLQPRDGVVERVALARQMSACRPAGRASAIARAGPCGRAHKSRRGFPAMNSGSAATARARSG